ncbi:MFS transporter [Arsenophonus endosymbiont of Bemisia tabaci]|uniref:MFS transporter n=1 Tax=Arsenophonus endosymbiont of Bemisia tabaci TaxID=536059 RepID=UPI0015F61FB2
MPVTDALAATWQKKLTFDYGKLRVWGSIAFIISASWIGYLANSRRHKIIIYALLVSIIIMLLTMLLQPTVMPKATYRQIANTTISLKQLLADSSVWRFFTVHYFITSFSCCLLWFFFNLLATSGLFQWYYWPVMVFKYCC